MQYQMQYGRQRWGEKPEDMAHGSAKQGNIPGVHKVVVTVRDAEGGTVPDDSV
jgi:hypothetical protein